MNEKNVDIFGINESWLSPSIHDASLAIQGYHPIARSDSPDGIRKHGVCFYISNKISFTSIDEKYPNVHIIFLNTLSCYCVLVYRPPSYSTTENEGLADFLQSFCYGKEVIIMGDFNLPGINWSQATLSAPSDLLSRTFLSCFTDLGLQQWVNFPTFTTSDNTLDLVLTSEHDRVGDVLGLPPLPGCKHVPIIWDYVFSLSSEQHI